MLYFYLRISGFDIRMENEKSPAIRAFFYMKQ